MRTAIHAALVSVVVLAITGCGREPEPEPRRSEPMAVEDTVFGDMIETQDRARGVEDLGFQRKQEMDQAIEQNAGQ
ncbi:MAG TPA: hypothetical protein VLT59_16955 [Steroidobacteraceae bacterium]|nr:hypothetical protein [Steroidobacteraceae bacterium]